MPDEQRIVIGGVDTHRDEHTAAAIDSAGRLLGTASFRAARDGCGQLLGWLRSFGGVECVGVEGTSSYGAGLARHLAAQGVGVVEVLRPKRRARRGDKSDPADAQAAARSVLSAEATARPKSAHGAVEAIRMLRAARRSAVKARTAAVNWLKALLVTAPRAGRRRAAGPSQRCFGGCVCPAAARDRRRCGYRRGEEVHARPGAPAPGAQRRDRRPRR